MSTILVVEDDPALTFVLKDNLEFEGYKTVTIADGHEAMSAIPALRPALIILDVMLPGLNGVQLCRALRQRGDRTPVLMLTARRQEHEKVQGLDAGADDYVTKPFGVQELLARVRAMLRRRTPNRERVDSYAFCGVEVDFKSGLALREGSRLALSQRQVELLRVLIEAGGEPVSRETLLRELWGDKEVPSVRSVDVHVTLLRRELGPAAGRHVLTVHGVGYAFIRETLPAEA
jgi:two-component system, OmpR family, response regulator MprA